MTDEEQETGYERRARKKRELILAKALELFHRHGFKKASVAEIAEAAGVSQVTIYKYFTDKEGLVEACVLRLMEERAARYRALLGSDRPFDERFAALIAFKEGGTKEVGSELVRSLYEDFPALLPRLAEERKRIFAEVTGPFLDEGRATGRIASSIRNESILVYLDVFAAGYAARPELVERITADEALYRELLELTFYGLVRGKDPEAARREGSGAGPASAPAPEAGPAAGPASA